MLLRLAAVATMLLGLSGVGIVGWVALHPAAPPPPVPVLVMQETPAAPPPPPVVRRVLAASGDLRAGTLLRPENVTAKELSDLPPGAQEDTEANRAAIVGAMLRRSLSPNETVQATDILRPGDHGFLAAVLAPNRRAASVAVDAVSGSAGLIWPGDHVDVILTQTLDNPALPPSRRVAAETVLSNVLVLAIDQLLARGVSPGPEVAGLGRTVTLEVTPGGAERIAVATRLGRLSLAARAAEDHGREGAERVLTTWGGDVSPALTPQAAPDAQSAVVHVYQGKADGKEFRF